MVENESLEYFIMEYPLETAESFIYPESCFVRFYAVWEVFTIIYLFVSLLIYLSNLVIYFSQCNDKLFSSYTVVRIIYT